MAIHVWQGGTGDYELAGNWSTGGGTPPPGDGDTAIFNGTTNVSMTLNVDQNSTDANLTSVFVEPSFVGDIGSSGSYYTTAADLFVFKGSGRMWLKAGQDVATDHIDSLIIDSPNSDGVFLGDLGSTELISRIVILSGKVTIDANSGTLASLEIAPGGATSSPPEVTINNSSSAITNVVMGGGTVTCDRPVTTFVQTGGQWTQELSGATAFSNTTIMGGTCIYNSTAAMAGKTFVGRGATLDLSSGSKDTTMAIAELFAAPGSVVMADSTLVSATVNHEYGRKMDLVS